MSVTEVIEKINSAAFLVIDSSVYLASEESARQSRYISFADHINVDKYKEIFNILMSAQTKKIYIALAHDVHWFGMDLEFLCSNIQGIVWAHHSAPISRKEFSSSKYYEAWGDKYGNYLENWTYIKEKVPSSIEMPFFAFKNEFLQNYKIFDVAVTGSHYKTRITAKNLLKKTTLFKEAPYEKIDSLIHLVTSKMPKNKITNLILIKLRALNQKFCTSHSFSSFVCGSFLRYPVAKFFEVPASGSLCLSMPCAQYNSYGFKEGVHYINTDPEHIIEVLKYVKLNRSHCQEIAKNAQVFVAEEHSFENRLYQLNNALIDFKKDKSIQAGYHDGKYEINIG